jgi:hypothetical protein
VFFNIEMQYDVGVLLFAQLIILPYHGEQWCLFFTRVATTACIKVKQATSQASIAA